MASYLERPLEEAVAAAAEYCEHTEYVSERAAELARRLALVTALVPSEMACLASSPGRIRRVAKDE